MGFVITARPSFTAAASAPVVRLPVVAKFKVVKLKTKSRPKKVGHGSVCIVRFRICFDVSPAANRGTRKHQLG